MSKIYFPLFVLLIAVSLIMSACRSNTDKPVTKAADTTKTTKESNSAKEITANEVNLNAEEKKRLNVFFSNFSEVGLPSFTSGKASEDDLINFGVLHLYKNNNDSFEKEDAVNAKIKVDKVSASVQKYFGKGISTNKSTSQFKFKNGYYFILLADGDAYTFSQVERLTDNGGDRYTAYVNVYTAGSGWAGNAHGSLKEWQANGDEVPELTGKFKAVFEKKNTENVLIEYVKQ
jgi:hypothetical protein